MIEKIVYDFLEQLKVNNIREWFADHKAFYLDAKTSFEYSISEVIALINTIDDSIGMIEPKDCIFRIYKDTRFSKDKTPYKTNMGAYIVNGGRKSPRGGYYIHAEPGSSFIAGGIYCPPADILKKVRREVYNFTDEFKAIIEDAHFRKMFPTFYQDKLKMAPKGFPRDFEDVDLLKYKSYIVSHKLTDEAMWGAGAKPLLSDAITTLKPLNAFINRGIDAEDEEVLL